jgi:serine/threonine protein kinase/Tfp pilus assembly protein PilF
MDAKTLGHYRIIEKIGSGGMGEVYRALDTRLDRSVALKILSPDTAKSPEMRLRFEREARAVAAIQHPNIVTIHSVEEVDDSLFLTMELVEGIDLSDAIPTGGFPLAAFLDLTILLADAVSSAHSKGITHRDLKPRNIMLARSGQIKVLDFGLAKLREPESAVAESDGTLSMSVTEEGTLLGTIAYMAPEQIRGLAVDHRCDIFSLGIILYEMLTGQHPYRSATSADTISAILRDRPPLASDVRPELPRRLAQLIDRCLEKDPNVRLQSALALRNDLEEIKRHLDAGREERFSSIAVLPPEDQSPAKDQGYFCEGLADTLARDLIKIRNLRVASRTSSLLCCRTTSDVREIGRSLGVEAILHGTVGRAGNRLRVTVELTEAASGYLLWSERYDREPQDVFVIQDEIARNVVQALKLTLTVGEERSMRATTTSDVEAYDYYLRGRRFFYQYRRKGIELALQMFERAARHDPAYALAYAGMADCHCFLFLYADRSRASIEEADRASRKALELNPDLAEAHASRGQVLSLQDRHDEAEAEFETAARLGPKLFEAHYLFARECFARGDLERAAHFFELASLVRPEDYQASLLVGQVYERLDRTNDAHSARERGVAIVEERLKLYPDDVRALYMGANGLMALGERERALEWATLALEMEPGEPMVLYNVACVFSMAGKLDEAIDYLERSVRSGLRQLGWFQNDANLDPLRTHPRFAALMRELQ